MKGKKASKSKLPTVKSTTAVKKASRRTKTEEKLANGFEGDEKKKSESEPEVIEDKIDGSEEENVSTNARVEAETVKSAEDVLAKNDQAGTSQETTKKAGSRKRKADVAVDKQKTTLQTKAKKIKAALEIPELSKISGKVFVVGDNTCGQLGFDEDIAEKKRPCLLDLPHSIVDIAAGGMHSVCLTENGEVITFGCNDEGALGRPTTEEGSENIPGKVSMPERVIQVSAGDSHSAALSESGQVYIWGNFRNNKGVIGLVTEGTKQVAPVKILNSIKVVKICSGTDHLSCLSEEGDVYTCGNGEVGQLGRVSQRDSEDGGRRGISLLLNPEKVSIKTSACVIDNIWTGSFATFLNEKKNGSIYAFGLNNHGQLGVVQPNPNENSIWKPKLIQSFKSRTWRSINGGQHHTLALENSGQVFSLGRSEYGRLGLGKDATSTSEPTLIPNLQNNNCIDVSSGNCVSFAVADDGSVYSWGMGTNFQLGHGNEDDQDEPKLIEGNFYNSWKAFKISGGGQHTLILAHPKQQAQKNVDEK